ncbi:MAG TPA: protein kinase [Ktedonobacteraceae bacterium]
MGEQSLIGKEVGNYRITSEMNSGTFGTVYKAAHTHFKERIVAIKLLHTRMDSLQERVQFSQEVQSQAGLEHPHILALLDFGFNEHRPYLITKYTTGGSLRDQLKRQVAFSIEKAISLLTQVGQALHHAHQQNIIHRDLKPENILFNAQGEALLTDFGIATMLSSARGKHLISMSETPQYMAPEHFRGVISKEGDQYSLGCVAYELMTGHLPFNAPDFLSLGFKHMNEQPIPPTRYNPSLPVAIEAAILKAMARQRNERYPTIPAFLTALLAAFTQPSARKVAPPMATGSPNARLTAMHFPSTQTSLHKVAPPTPTQPPIKQLSPTSGPHTQTTLRSSTPATLSTPFAPPDTISAARSQERSPQMNGKSYNIPYTSEAQTLNTQTTFHHPRQINTYLNQNTSASIPISAKETNRAKPPIVRSNSDEALAYYYRGIALSTLSRYEEAIEAFDQSTHFNPQHALAHFNRGIALSAIQRYEEAISAYSEAIRLDPHHALTRYKLGLLLHHLKRYNEAVGAFDQAIRLDPAYGSAYYGKGDALEQCGKRREAKQAYKKAEQLLEIR